MNKPKLNQSDVEQTTTTCPSCHKYPRKKFVMVDGKFVGIPAPTIEEVKEEWEELGYEVIYRANHIIFRHRVTYKTIEIFLINLSYKTYEWYDEKRPIADRLNIDEAQFITFDLHNLIHKTLMALGKEV